MTISINTVFTEKDQKTFKKNLLTNASFYKDFKAMIATDTKLKNFFAQNTAKEIYLELFDEQEQAKNPLYIERKKTPLCCAIDNLKRLCKDPKEKKESNGKKVEQIQKELLYIQENFNNYTTAEQNSILAQIDHLLKGIKYKTK